MIIQIYEGSLDNPVEYFEKLPLYPEWIKQSKLLFTWKKISWYKNPWLEQNSFKARDTQATLWTWQMHQYVAVTVVYVVLHVQHMIFIQFLWMGVHFPWKGLLLVQSDDNEIKMFAS